MPIGRVKINGDPGAEQLRGDCCEQQQAPRQQQMDQIEA